MKQTKITLEENEIPQRWYNIVADMPNKPLPPLNPATKEPIGPEALAPLFPMALIQQEVSEHAGAPEMLVGLDAFRPVPFFTTVLHPTAYTLLVQGFRNQNDFRVTLLHDYLVKRADTVDSHALEPIPILMEGG